MPLIKRRQAIAQTSALLWSAAVSTRAWSQGYPARPIRIIVAYPPGGSTDLVGRALAQRLAETTGQPVVVENKPGASGAIGTDFVVKAAPDGHTLLITTHLLVQTHTLQPALPYDPLRDLAPITNLLTSPVWLAVRSDTGITTLDEFVKRGKTKGHLAYASVGNGSMGHLYGNRLGQMFSLDLTHVPYKGAAPVVMAMMSGEVDAAFSDYSTMRPFVQSGKLRPLAVADVKRSPLTPDVPTFAELGFPGFEASSWLGLFAPARTPSEIVQKLNAEVSRILKEPAFASRFKDQGFDIGGKSPAAFSSQMSTEFTMWAALIKSAGIKAE